ncbi:hypothetical protein [Nonomuraea pusilla]|uniref:Uncharacterized protein n=1 Tax=Nonomuraea pusilla TaxID=46177 RepID=A0A1H7WZB8_9ACTN|nr:hypothetical protein [Nonomuraea pusilla]SEM26178.1 hypothetical protein SAMN05660976_04652 [Nonomuraea pusilla]
MRGRPRTGGCSAQGCSGGGSSATAVGCEARDAAGDGFEILAPNRTGPQRDTSFQRLISGTVGAHSSVSAIG